MKVLAAWVLWAILEYAFALRNACPSQALCVPSANCREGSSLHTFNITVDSKPVEYLCGIVETEGYVCCLENGTYNLTYSYTPSLKNWYYRKDNTSESTTGLMVNPWPGFDSVELETPMKRKPSICPSFSVCVPPSVCPAVAIRYASYISPAYDRFLCGNTHDSDRWSCCSIHPFINAIYSVLHPENNPAPRTAELDLRKEVIKHRQPYPALSLYRKTFSYPVNENAENIDSDAGGRHRRSISTVDVKGSTSPDFKNVIPVGNDTVVTITAAQVYTGPSNKTEPTGRSTEEIGRQAQQDIGCGRIKSPAGPPSTTYNANIASSGITREGQYPWHVAILTIKNEYLCGGTIVSERHVITVAHCIDKLTAPSIRVRVGDYDLTGNVESIPSYDVEVNNIVYHPDYTRESLKADLAVLFLKFPVLSLPNVNRVCLPGEGAPSDKHECYVPGWGSVTPAKDSAQRYTNFHPVLKHSGLVPVDRDRCQSQFRNEMSLGTFFKLLPGVGCVKGVLQADSCHGDGGSGVVCRTAAGEFVLEGLISWSAGCDRGLPTALVDVAFYAGFILNVIRSQTFQGQATSGQFASFQQGAGVFQQASSFSGSQQSYGVSGSQQSSGFTGSQQASGFSGSQQSSGYGTQQSSGFTDSQQASSFSGSQQLYGVSGSQQTSGFSGSQQSPGFSGGQQLYGASGSQQSSGYSSSQQGSSVSGSQQASSFTSSQTYGLAGSQQTGFGSQQVNYGPQQPGFGPPQDGYNVQQTGYGSQQVSYGNQDASYGSQQSGYGNQDANYGSQQSGYGSQQSGYGSQQSGYGSQQAEYGSLQFGYGSQQAGYQASYGSQAPGYGPPDYGNNEYRPDNSGGFVPPGPYGNEYRPHFFNKHDQDFNQYGKFDYEYGSNEKYGYNNANQYGYGDKDDRYRQIDYNYGQDYDKYGSQGHGGGFGYKFNKYDQSYGGYGKYETKEEYGSNYKYDGYKGDRYRDTKYLEEYDDHKFDKYDNKYGSGYKQDKYTDGYDKNHNDYEDSHSKRKDYIEAFSGGYDGYKKNEDDDGRYGEGYYNTFSEYLDKFDDKYGYEKKDQYKNQKSEKYEKNDYGKNDYAKNEYGKNEYGTNSEHGTYANSNYNFQHSNLHQRPGDGYSNEHDEWHKKNDKDHPGYTGNKGYETNQYYSQSSSSYSSGSSYNTGNTYSGTQEFHGREALGETRGTQSAAPKSQVTGAQSTGPQAPGTQSSNQQAPGAQSTSPQAPGTQPSSLQTPGTQSAGKSVPGKQTPGSQSGDINASSPGQGIVGYLKTRYPNGTQA